MGISTPGPSQAPILRHEDLRGGEVMASSTRMPNFIWSEEFAIWFTELEGAAGQGWCLLPLLPLAPTGAGLGCQHGGQPVLCPSGMVTHGGSRGCSPPRCRFWDWGHVKEARFDEVTATEPSRDCCRGTAGISHSSPRSPSPSFTKETKQSDCLLE